MKWPQVAALVAAVAIILVLFLLAAAQNGPKARKLIIVPAGFAGVMGVNEGMELSRDPSRRITLPAILSGSQRFQAATRQGLNLGYSRDAAWLKLSLRSARGAQRLLLSLTPTFVDLLTVHVAQVGRGRPPKPGDFQRFELGDHRPIPDDGVSVAAHVVPITVQEDKDTLIYMRVASVGSSLNLSAEVHAESRHILRISENLLANGLWIGAMLILLLIQLVFFALRRSSSDLYLAFSTFAATLVYVGNLGVSRLLLFPYGGHGNDYFLSISVWLGLTASSFAVTSILQLRSRAPMMARLFQFGALFGIVGMAFSVAGRNVQFAPLGGPVVLALATAAMVQSIRDANVDGNTTRLNAAAYSVLWFGLMCSIAQRGGYAPLPDWVAHTYAVTTVLQALFLTSALAVRLRSAERLNRLMQDQAIIDAREAELRAIAMVEEKTQELAASKVMAEDALRAELDSQAQQVQLMEIISHQYRTPLATISSNVDSIGASLPASDLQNLDRVRRAKRGITRLVETLEVALIRGRIQGHSLRPNREVVLLGELISTITSRAGDYLHKANFDLSFSRSARKTPIFTDTEMVTIAIINILENAVKYGRPDAPDSISLKCTIKDDCAVIIIADHGVGIPPDEISRVIERSFRASNTQTTEGSGLGLFLVNRIVDALGGEIAIKSKLGHGTTVYLSIPLVPSEVAHNLDQSL
ncbi:sensor histidine kinase [Sphingobium sp. B12D2B]|uniref:sensor histidine kinase n=1 Tax=Sphingobium sp. B12D2B TaxID=2940577 RepID=UPI0022246AB7|nr:sensor histidine kinase [Sphingobium sp. B12D2B]MCW2351814.1 signal transduction histidine kinase [Sphingobium sp. B12D2B]